MYNRVHLRPEGDSQGPGLRLWASLRVTVRGLRLGGVIVRGQAVG